jgi:4-hydroxybenzoate polyprenyltransferase
VTGGARWVGYGGAAALIVIGVLCAVLVSGGTGPVLAIAFIGVGLVAAVSMVFAEIGFSEDRELDREARARERPARAGSRRVRRPSRLDRRRGQRRQLP